MGLYDTIQFYGDAEPRCSAGHPLGELQTKDLDCGLNAYSVFAERLYRPGTERTECAQLDGRGRLVLSEARAAEPASISADITAYGYCTECRLVLFLRDSTFAHDYVDERRP
jgi:hypothetical protein